MQCRRLVVGNQHHGRCWWDREDTVTGHADVDVHAEAPDASWREVLTAEYAIAQAQLHAAAEDWNELGEYI